MLQLTHGILLARVDEGQERSPESGSIKSRASSRMMPELPSSFYVVATCLTAVLLRARIADHITLPVQAGDKHWPPMLLASRLIRTDEWRLIALGRHVP